MVTGRYQLKPIVRYPLISIVSLVVGAVCFGGTTETKYEIVEYPQEVTKTVEVPKPFYPSECRDLARYSLNVADAGSTMDATSAAMLDIMSRLRVAVATDDTNAANDLETELRQLNSQTVGAVETLGLARDKIATAADACTKGN